MKIISEDEQIARLNAMNIAMDGSRGKTWQIDEIIDNAKKIQAFLEGKDETTTGPQVLNEEK